MIPLKPCPSCKNHVSVEENGVYIENRPFTRYKYFVRCKNPSCKKKPVTFQYSTEEYARIAWNKNDRIRG